MQTAESHIDIPEGTPSERVFNWVFQKLTPRHGRRILFITSLYFQVVRIESMKQEVVERLNRIMGLASAESALQFPIAVRNLLWRNKGLEQIIREEDLASPISHSRALDISNSVVDRMPPYLRYDDRSVMVSDVCELLHNGRLLSEPA